MPYFCASASGFPGVGEPTATTSASSGMIWNAAAWISASNRDPMIPTFTLPAIFLNLPVGLKLRRLFSPTRAVVSLDERRSFGATRRRHRLGIPAEILARSKGEVGDEHGLGQPSREAVE